LYLRGLWTQHFDWLPFATGLSKQGWQAIHQKYDLEPLKEQVDETFERLNRMEVLVRDVLSKDPDKRSRSEKVDTVITHWFWGPLIFAVIMLFVFQAIFAWATYPMDAIESTFGYIGNSLSQLLPDAWYTRLLTEGVVPGLSGVLIFIPQIAILFLLISLLEEIGYMSRAVYLFDHFMQRFGMNGRSVVALISGGACAIPAIMSTRTISNWKERLITIMVTPFISCSARIPVYAVLIAFVVPYERVAVVFNTQGLAFAGLYILGIAAAFLAAYVLKKILKSKSYSFFVMELPAYRIPDWINVWRNVKDKVAAFIMEAGKIILIISMVLWFLASYGPGKAMEIAEEQAQVEVQDLNLTGQAAEDLINAKRLESSFAGILGKSVEPIVKPLGYDWKIGIALITAFAAREVFVGSMATIYSIGSEEDQFRIREHLAKQRDPVTQEPVFNYATALSLLLFFVLAMQCMSTLAVVKKETSTWKWPIIQFTFMTVAAYVVSLVAYQCLS
ncbi:MAG: ferrous iron transport protein B, partial [Saprospiraceae bacterium]|nr:ferrous iron transport protein B [Saprospiraceae bacterium]